MREGETYDSWVWAAESPRGATDQDGRVPKSAAQSSVGLKYLYASRPWSPVAEATHNRARWYSPEAGRFLTRDPIGYLGGVNQYMYAAGNPIGFRDPWGLREEPEGNNNWSTPVWFPNAGGYFGYDDIRLSFLSLSTIYGVWHYYFGGSDPVHYDANLFINSAPVNNFRMAVEDDLERRSALHGPNVHGTQRSYHQHVNNIDTVWVMGKGQLDATVFYRYNQDTGETTARIRYSIRDEFKDPLGIGVEIPGGILFPPRPYQQRVEWSENWPATPPPPAPRSPPNYVPVPMMPPHAIAP